MSYLTPYYPHAIKAYLETRPALAELADTIAIYLLALAATGLLIFWSVKFYRPKPIRPKEAKPERSIFEAGLGFKFILTAICLLGLIVGVVAVLIGLALFANTVYMLFNGQGWQEMAFILSVFFFSVFCLWLIGRS